MNLFGNILINSSLMFATLVNIIADSSSDVRVSDVTPTSVKLSWSSPHIASVDTKHVQYVISYKQRSSAATSRSPDVIGGITTTHYTIRSLQLATQYEFTVSAVEGSTNVGRLLAPAVVATTRHVECMGTNQKSNMLPNRHYQNLKDRYTNCTYVNGNLELTWLKKENLDFSFLHHIREITGYVLFAYVNVSKIVIPRLQIIWGRTRFKFNSKIHEYSLYILSSSIESIELPSLREIVAGDVGIKSSYLCHFYTINWDDIINSDGNKWKLEINREYTEQNCPPCDQSCQVESCWGVGFHNCQTFSKINCSHKCNQSRCFEPSPEGCCHPFCAGGCTGPKQSDCLSCLYSYEDGVCIGEDPTKNNNNRIILKLLYCAIVTVLIVVGVLLIALLLHRRKRVRVNETAVNMAKAMELTRMKDDFSLRLSNVMPNTAKLRIIKEVDLRIGAELGNGAFGIVYKGIWIVEGKTIKIPVAIKKVHKKNDTYGYENSSREFLNEAHIMARVEHRYLVKLLAVCMTSEPILVTELMPLGCLLKYVQNNKNKIGSKSLLKWSTQIAKGMAYLEENRLVHRDLAARNVLVQNVNNVKISDFGLAKLLDIDQPEFTVEHGKMPVKWLAPECLKYGVFTHKSDVWAFGITVWELLTYGEQPYGSVKIQEMPSLLERGERLPQPPICTIDVYMVMVKCWLTEKDDRPSFKELANEFTKMAIDPGRYLVIPRDRYMRLPFSRSQNDFETLSNLVDEETTMTSIIVTDECTNPKIGNGFGTSDGLFDKSKTKKYTLKLDTSVDEDDYLLPFSTNDGLDKKRRHSFPSDVQLIGQRYVGLIKRSSSLRLLKSPSLASNHSFMSTRTHLSAVDNPEYHMTGGEPSAMVANLSCRPQENSVDICDEHQSVVPSTSHQGR